MRIFLLWTLACVLLTLTAGCGSNAPKPCSPAWISQAQSADAYLAARSHDATGVVVAGQVLGSEMAQICK